MDGAGDLLMYSSFLLRMFHLSCLGWNIERKEKHLSWVKIRDGMERGVRLEVYGYT